MKLGPSPARGKYDRSKSEAQRACERRARVIASTAAVLGRTRSPAGLVVPVGDIIEEAGISRRSFYEQFSDSNSAVVAVAETWCERFQELATALLTQSATPVQRWRELSHCWLAGARSAPDYAWIALSLYRNNSVFTLAGSALSEAVREALLLARREGAVGEVSSEAVVALIGAAEALARVSVATPSNAPDEELLLQQFLILR